MRINCIIVEDEPLAMQRTRSYVQQLPFLDLLQTFDNGIEASSFIQTNKVDLLFLDIQMDGLTGIQLLKSLEHYPEVIITTAFDKYAVEGFELNVTDYLVKPFSFDRFLQAVNRVHDQLNIVGDKEQPNFMFIKTEYRLEKIFFGDILYIEGMSDYRKIFTTKKNIMTLFTLKDFEQSLPTKQFCRVHKSYIVSLEKVDSIERDIIKMQNELIPISSSYKELFYKRINFKNR